MKGCQCCSQISAGQTATRRTAQTVGGLLGSGPNGSTGIHALGWVPLGRTSGRRLGGTILSLQTHQLPAAAKDNLAEILKTGFQLAEHLFGVSIGPILNGTSILTGAGHEHIALLLGLLAELDGLLMEPLGFSLTLPLNPQALLTDRFQLLQRLLPNPFMLIHQLAGPLYRLRFQLGAALLSLLLQLLTTGGKGLLHLGDPPLMLLLGLGGLSTGLGL